MHQNLFTVEFRPDALWELTTLLQTPSWIYLERGKGGRWKGEWREVEERREVEGRRGGNGGGRGKEGNIWTSLADKSWRRPWLVVCRPSTFT